MHFGVTAETYLITKLLSSSKCWEKWSRNNKGSRNIIAWKLSNHTGSAEAINVTSNCTQFGVWRCSSFYNQFMKLIFHLVGSIFLEKNENLSMHNIFGSKDSIRRIVVEIKEWHTHINTADKYKLQLLSWGHACRRTHHKSHTSLKSQRLVVQTELYLSA